LKGVFVVAALIVAAACSDSTRFEMPLTLTVTTTTPTASVGDTVVFEVAATGSSLIGVFLDYGDEDADTFNLRTLVTSITSTLSHEYQAAGTFLVEAHADDAQEGRIADTISVTISP
jgi:hypothetical protein